MRKDGVGKAEQERLMEEFNRDMSKMTNKMDADRMRMQADLEVGTILLMGRGVDFRNGYVVHETITLHLSTYYQLMMVA